MCIRDSAYAAACAIACGIAEGITEHASVYSILKACIYGAKRGEEIGLREARHASGARMLPKTVSYTHLYGSRVALYM